MELSASLTEPLLQANETNEVVLDHDEETSLRDHGFNDDSSIPSSSDSTVVVTPTKSKNINLILAYTFCVFSARSLWNQSVLSVFVFLLKADDPKYVGFMTAIVGISQLLTSFPAGILADKYRRDSLLRASSIVGAVAAVSTFIASRMENFFFLGCALAMWGFFWGLSFGPISALFADSINDGDRSHYFTQRMLLQFLGNTVGPAVALFMFSKLGDDWTTGECSVVIGVGQVLSLPALVLLFLVSDDYCIDEDAASDSGTATDTDTDTDLITDGSISDVENSAEGGGTLDDLAEPSPSVEDALGLEKQQEPNFLCIPSTRIVPVLVASSDVLGGLAAGMSIQYFPIFFKEYLKLTPAQVQIIFISSMTSMAIMGKLVQWIGTKIGRVQTALICKWIGALLLLSMVNAYQSQASPLCVIIIFLVRTACMNAPNALTRSVLMDHVPKHERARWNSLESVNMFSWSGSALLGGFLVDYEGIEFNFYATAALQIVATIPLIFVFGRVRSEN